MKKSIISLSCLVVMSAFGCEAAANTITAQCTATIVPAISGAKNTRTPTGGDLAFGIIVPGASSGTVTITPSTSARTASGGVQLVSSISGPAVFDVAGVANSAYTVTLPNDGTVTISNGTNVMAVNGFSAVSTSGNPKLDSDGLGSFLVGGRLEVSANQPQGSYRGTFDVIVTYQ